MLVSQIRYTKYNSLSHSCGMLFGQVECVHVATTVLHQLQHVLTMLLLPFCDVITKWHLNLVSKGMEQQTNKTYLDKLYTDDKLDKFNQLHVVTSLFFKLL